MKCPKCEKECWQGTYEQHAPHCHAKAKAERPLDAANCSDSFSLTPITDQRIALLKQGYAKYLPKWEEFARGLELEARKWKNLHHVAQLNLKVADDSKMNAEDDL